MFQTGWKHTTFEIYWGKFHLHPSKLASARLGAPESHVIFLTERLRLGYGLPNRKLTPENSEGAFAVGFRGGILKKIVKEDCKVGLPVLNWSYNPYIIPYI